MRTFAIGDIHGHFDQWLLLYEKIKKDASFNPKKDQLVFLGDYVDGGSQVKELLDWLIDHKKKYPHWQMLYGNHEDLLLDALIYKGQIYGSYDLWWMQGGKATYESYVPKDLSEYSKAISQVKDHIKLEHLDFLRNLPIYYENDSYFFVHAGLRPDMTIEEHKKALEDDKSIKNPIRQEMIWIRDLFINSFNDWGKKIIFGHTAFSTPNFYPNKIGIDCMRHEVGTLIALELPKEVVYDEVSR